MTGFLHGYAMADLDSVARRAAFGRGAGYAYPEAWSAVAEALCTAAERPGFGTLLLAATRGVDRAIRSAMRARGLYYDSPSATGSQFWRYWAGQPKLDAASWEEQVDDRRALTQIWPRLSPTDQEALLALATYEQYHLAADALGINYDAFGKRVRRARRAFRELWHDWETPSKTWGRDHRKHLSDSETAQSRYNATYRPRRRARTGRPSGGDPT